MTPDDVALTPEEVAELREDRMRHWTEDLAREHAVPFLMFALCRRGPGPDINRFIVHGGKSLTSEELMEIQTHVERLILGDRPIPWRRLTPVRPARESPFPLDSNKEKTPSGGSRLKDGEPARTPEEIAELREERMRRWSEFLAAENALPFLLFAVSRRGPGRAPGLEILRFITLGGPPLTREEATELQNHMLSLELKD